jgi:hypothetical protein
LVRSQSLPWGSLLLSAAPPWIPLFSNTMCKYIHGCKPASWALVRQNNRFKIPCHYRQYTFIWTPPHSFFATGDTFTCSFGEDRLSGPCPSPRPSSSKSGPLLNPFSQLLISIGINHMIDQFTWPSP